MGIVNATPDSFFDGGRYPDQDLLFARCKALMNMGADWIDIGGESTRPGAQLISAQEECDRVLPLIEAIAPIAKAKNIAISIDTTKAQVAQQASSAGATILNDVRGLQDDDMAEVSSLFSKTIVMHSRGRPQTMNQLCNYEHLIEEITEELIKGANRALSKEVWLDPGIGFAKTAQQSLTLLQHTNKLCSLGFPILIGASRKSFIGSTLGCPKEERLAGSLAAVAASYHRGAQAWRVHDVLETRQLLDLLWSIDTV